MSADTLKRFMIRREVLFGILVLVLSYFTYAHNYTMPPYLYWDENYHIASAQKYLNGVFFMEPHPPLAKMLIALGEKILDRNPIDDQFIGTDYGTELPQGFSFAGYRLFPVLAAWLIAPMLYGVFLMITRKSFWALILSFLYIFDTALITHSRAAMLDSIMLFWTVAMILCYFLILEYRRRQHAFSMYSLLLGVSFGALMATKALGLIMILLFPVLCLQLAAPSRSGKKLEFHVSRDALRRTGQFLALGIVGFAVTYAAVWQTHFSLGKRIVDSLSDKGYYQASETYQAYLNAGRTNFPLMLRENLAFLKHYAGGVPVLNLCKSDENGAPFFFWPLGARAINYRWESPDSESYRYITLVVNPAIWLVALLGVLLAFALLAGSWLLPTDKGATLTHRRGLLIWFLLWLSYMIAVSQIDRVMYLYHYFIPFIFSMILVAYVIMELQRIGPIELTEERKNWAMLVMGALFFAVFLAYKPLSYYEPIKDEAFEKLMIFPLWELHCVNCPKDSMLADPLLEN